MTDEDKLEALAEPAAALVRHYFDARGKPVEPLPNGMVATPLGGTAFDAPWQMWLATGGSDGSWLVAQVRAAHRVPRGRWPDALAACNTWNGTSPLTKAWLAVADWDEADDGALVLEASLPVDGAGAQEAVDAFLDALARDAAEFWRLLLRG
jgi:hypothetical protein